MNTIWKVIPNYEKYEASNTGLIRDVRAKCIVAPYTGTKYNRMKELYVRIYDNNNKKHTFSVATLVIYAFHPELKQKEHFDVRYSNGNYYNVALNNLVVFTSDIGFNPGNQLQRIKGLCQIVICSQIKPENIVTVKILGRKNHNGNIAVLSDLFDQIISVHFGKHDIHHSQIYLLFLCLLIGKQTIQCMDDFVTFIFKIKLDKFRNILIILRYQYFIFHRISPSFQYLCELFYHSIHFG